MKKTLLGTCTALAMVLGAGGAFAAPTVNILTNESNPIPDQPIFSTDLFSLLAGASVTFNNQTTTWAAGNGLWGNGAQCGGAAIGGFSLGGCGDTFGQNWFLDNNATSVLTSFQVDLTPIGHFFDRTDPSPGTTGSFNGRDFTYVSDTLTSSGGTIGVTYSIPGISAPRDLYGIMDVDLTGLTSGATGITNGLQTGAQLVFEQDTDFSEVPVPAAGWLLVTSLGALAAVRRRRRS